MEEERELRSILKEMKRLRGAIASGDGERAVRSYLLSVPQKSYSVNVRMRNQEGKILFERQSINFYKEIKDALRHGDVDETLAESMRSIEQTLRPKPSWTHGSVGYARLGNMSHEE